MGKNAAHLIAMKDFELPNYGLHSSLTLPKTTAEPDSVAIAVNVYWMDLDLTNCRYLVFSMPMRWRILSRGFAVQLLWPLEPVK